MKKLSLLLTLVIVLSVSTLKAQNSPFSIWGPSLDGSTLQRAAIYADPYYGFLFESPLNASGTKIPLEFNWRGGGTPALKILGDGNVGIGMANPQAKLDVAGRIRSFYVGIGQDDVLSSTKNYVNLGSNNHGSLLLSSNLFMSSTEDLKIANTHATMSGSAILIPGNQRPNQGSIIFYTNQPAAVTENSTFTGSAAMTIKGNGNIAIGTDDPRGNKLAVAGSIIAESVTVKMQGTWPDYVFSETYQLPSLTDLKYYISENKHLPNFPSATDIEKSGINLGEMNKALTQKVEELTLYLIEKDQKEKEQTLLNQKINAQLTLQNKINQDLQDQLTAILKKLESSSHPKKVN